MSELRGVVITGVWGAGKSTLAHAITEELAAVGAPCYIALPQTLVSNGDSRAIDADADARRVVATMRSTADALALFDDRISHTWAGDHLADAQSGMVAVLEGFTFDARLYHPLISATDVGDIERTLARLGFEVVHLHVPDEAIVERCVKSTIAHRGANWESWLRATAGPSDSAIADIVRERQTALESWIATSPLPVRTIDSTREDLRAVAREIVATRTPLARSVPEREL